jgi:hypothetical protein
MEFNVRLDAAHGVAQARHEEKVLSAKLLRPQPALYRYKVQAQLGHELRARSAGKLALGLLVLAFLAGDLDS